jgi:hypothetical protein
MRWPLRNNRLDGNMRLPIWYILNSLDLFLSWDMILALVQICVWTFFMANLIIYSYVLSLCMVSKSPTFAIDVEPFDAGPQILFNLYQKESNFLAHGVGLLYGIGDDREVLLFLQLYVALSWAAASTFIFVEAGLCIFFIEADSLFSGSFIVVDFYDPSSAGLLSLYRFADRDNHRTDDGVEDFIFSGLHASGFPHNSVLSAFRL